MNNDIRRAIRCVWVSIRQAWRLSGLAVREVLWQATWLLCRTSLTGYFCSLPWRGVRTYAAGDLSVTLPPMVTISEDV